MNSNSNEDRQRGPQEISVPFPRILHERFERICEEKGFSKSEIIRTLVDDFVEEHSDEYDPVSDPDQMEAF